VESPRAGELLDKDKIISGKVLHLRYWEFQNDLSERRRFAWPLFALRSHTMPVEESGMGTFLTVFDEK
jgi:hypothetical protein